MQRKMQRTIVCDASPACDVRSADWGVAGDARVKEKRVVPEIDINFYFFKNSATNSASKVAAVATAGPVVVSGVACI